MNTDGPTRRTLLAAMGSSIAVTAAGCVDSAGGEDCPDPDIPPRTEWQLGSDRDGREVIAHRGCAAQFPENTLYAFERVSPYVDGIELDVRRAESGEIVVFHDETLDRLTACSGEVAQRDYEALASCDVGCTDDGVPRLGDAFEVIPPDVQVNVELKTAGIADEVTSIAAAVEHEILVSSFLPEALQEIRDSDSSVPIALVTDQRLRESLAVARDLGCSALHPRYDLSELSATVEEAHADGIRINVWTIDDESGVEVAVEAGVDGMFVDRLDIL
ncbi:glycerophosphodiester phosphodiesterase [Halalkalirubrum salinum]|uniref:glycerophosphodiester phosphodiesterase n=1 Tax=Halalkalirubrum salinum TaxID=2563889 RepID=UPI0010FB5A97|nr:glycerophosphodiester phosphodiesterase family protein [Halalkalirubrum salinum]